MSLKQELDAFAAGFARAMPTDIVQALEESIDAVKRSGIAGRAIKAGARAPDFSLPNAQGRQLALGDLLAKGPIILSFYRGSWCPYCNLELNAYQAILPEIRAAGGDLVAISPQAPDLSVLAARKNGLEFEILSDHGNRVAGLFGIAYPIPGIVKAIGTKFGTDLAVINGSDDGQLPVSASYVIARDRRIVLAAIEPDFRLRLEPAEALRMLRSLGATPGATPGANPGSAGADAVRPASATPA